MLEELLQQVCQKALQPELARSQKNETAVHDSCMIMITKSIQ